MILLHINSKGLVAPSDLTKEQVMERHALHQRDLRPLVLLNQAPTLLVRGKCYIVNLDFLRMLITEDAAYVFDVGEPESAHFFKDLEKRFASVQNNHSNFAYAVLETALLIRHKYAEKDYAKLKKEMSVAFATLEDTQNDDNLEKLLALKKRLSAQETTVVQLLTATHGIIDDEAALMDLDFNEDKSHLDEIESILEHYEEQVDQLYHHLEDLRENVEDTEAIIQLKMSNKRNDLIRLELFFVVMTASMAFPTLVVGVFGMNLVNTQERSFFAFLTVCAVIVLTMLWVAIGAWRFVQRKKLF